MKFYDLKRGERFTMNRKTYIVIGFDSPFVKYRHCRSKEVLVTFSCYDIPTTQPRPTNRSTSHD